MTCTETWSIDSGVSFIADIIVVSLTSKTDSTEDCISLGGVERRVSLVSPLTHE